MKKNTPRNSAGWPYKVIQLFRITTLAVMFFTNNPSSLAVNFSPSFGECPIIMGREGFP